MKCQRVVIQIVLGAIATLMASSVVGAQKSPELRGRPIVIFVHGRNQANKTADALENEWFSAFSDGLEKVNAKSLLEKGDRRLLRYERFFESDAKAGPSCISSEVSPGAKLASKYDEEAAFVEAILRSQRSLVTIPAKVRDTVTYKNAAKTRADAVNSLLLASEATFNLEASSLTETEEARAKGTAGVLKWLRDRAQEVVEPEFVIRFLSDTRTYLELGWQACETEGLVRNGLEDARKMGRPVILVSHSMGAMVTYRVLSSQRTDGLRPQVPLYVTLGSQLGWDKIPPLLIGGMAKPPFAAPAAVGTWLNVRGANDLISWDTDDNFRPTLSGLPVKDITVNTGQKKQAHSISLYLQRRRVALPIAAAWCSAFVPPATAPSGCAQVIELFKKEGLVGDPEKP